MSAFQIIFYIVIIGVPAALLWVLLFGVTKHWPPQGTDERRHRLRRRGRES